MEITSKTASEIDEAKEKEDLKVLEAVLPGLGDSLEQTLSKLLEAEILYRRKSGKQAVYQFKHALIQDAAYESLLKSRRQQIHHDQHDVRAILPKDVDGLVSKNPRQIRLFQGHTQS